jgi:hypothetical protein
LPGELQILRSCGPAPHVGSRDPGGFSGSRVPPPPCRPRCIDSRKGALRRTRKIGNAHIFEPIVERDIARHRLLDTILSFFGGRAQPMMAQLVEAGKLTLDDVRDLEKAIRKRARQQGTEGTRKK